MVHTTLEEHIDESCPRCGKEHESKWTLEVDVRYHYFKLTCEDCKYVVFKKISFQVHSLDHLPP
ncbi:MAG: hypothetical protein WC758_00095 [Candidatus Woesearchaeota archaeon]